MRALLLLLSLLTSGALLPLPALAESSQDAGFEGEKPATVVNPAAELWNKVRQREWPGFAGSTQIGQMNAGELVNPSGEQWRLFRRDELIPIGGWLLLAALGAVLLLALIRPSVPLPGGESGQRLWRFNALRRVTHWVMAISMLVLGITGLVIFAGRYLLLPWLGKESFGALAALTQQIHELSGPLFAAALLTFFVLFVARNLPTAVDLKWLLRLGGLVGGEHPPAGFFNAGEKILFWMVVLLGMLLSASGLALLFAHLVQDRALLQLLVIVHGISALLLIATVSGHIYMALAVRGTLRAMRDGYVDANWARSHHPLWFEEQARRGALEADCAAPQAEADEGGTAARASGH